MRSPLIKATAGGFAAALVAATIVIPPASADTTGAVPFSQASFSGYATGTELHLGTTVLNSLSQLTGQNLSQITGLTLNGLDQGFSSATTNTSGLATPLNNELQTLIQPVEAATVKAFDEGQGINLDLGGTTGQQLSGLANTLLAAAQQAIPPKAVSMAPPNPLSGVIHQSSLNLDPIANVQSLVGEAQADFPTQSCPTSNISYGLGNLTAANLLTGLPALTTSGVNTAPLISTAGSGTSVSQSKSTTGLVSNGDGTYGIQTQASDIIAPISINLLGLATLQIAVQSAGGVNDPVTLTATTTGEGTGASVKLSSDDLVTVDLISGGQDQQLINVPLTAIGPNGFHQDLTLNLANLLLSNLPDLPGVLVQTLQGVLASLPSGSSLQTPITTVVNALQPVLTQVTNVVNTVASQPTVQQLLGLINGTLSLNLGHIDIDTTPHAIGKSWDTAPTTVGGTQAGGALDLINLKLGLTNSFINIGGQSVTLPSGQTVSIPAIQKIALPDVQLANPVIGHLETQSIQQQPISCAQTQAQTAATTVPPLAPKSLPFTGGPGGLWQPVVGVGTLGLGGFSLALVRRLRKRSVV